MLTGEMSPEADQILSGVMHGVADFVMDSIDFFVDVASYAAQTALGLDSSHIEDVQAMADNYEQCRENADRWIQEKFGYSDSDKMYQTVRSVTTITSHVLSIFAAGYGVARAGWSCCRCMKKCLREHRYWKAAEKNPVHLYQKVKYGVCSWEKMDTGKIRYFGPVTPAKKPGKMAGRRVVREWDPITGQKSTWMDTVDHSGNTRSIRPEWGKGQPHVHYTFDKDGNFTGTR